jgi:hypothetical protein
MSWSRIFFPPLSCYLIGRGKERITKNPMLLRGEERRNQFLFFFSFRLLWRFLFVRFLCWLLNRDYKCLFILLQLLSVVHWVLQSWIVIFVYWTSTFPLVPPWTLLGYSQGNECITNTGTVSIASGIQVVIGNILCERTKCHLKLVKNLGMYLITSHVNHQLKHGFVVGNVVKMQNEVVQLGCIEFCLKSHLEHICM